MRVTATAAFAAIYAVGCSADNTRETAQELAMLVAPPLVAIGVGGDELFQVAGGVLLGDTIVLAERSTARIKMFDLAGNLLASLGGSGQGPGEYTQVSWVRHGPHGLIVYDGAQRRLSHLARNGDFIRSVIVEPREHYANTVPLGAFEDGSLLVWASPVAPQGRFQGVVRRSSVLLRYSAEGRFIDSVGSYYGSETYIEPFGRAGEMISALAFGKQSMAVVGRQHFYVVENRGDTIERFNPDGTRLTSLRPGLSMVEVAVTPDDIAIARARFTAGEVPNLPLGPMFDRMPLPRAFPTYGWESSNRVSLMRATGSGEVWVVRYGGIRSGPQMWYVFDGDGRYTGSVQADGEFEVLDADGLRALVLTWDANGVERVELRRVSR